MRSRLIPFLLLVLACNDQKLGRFNSSPIASITSHIEGDEALEGYAIDVRGSASDPNDASEDLLASWYLGDTLVCDATVPTAEGLTTCTMSPTPGEDTITLEVWDPEGASASAKVQLQVTPTDPPLAEILAPLEEARLYSDQKVSLQARVSDNEDSAGELQLAWRSDLDDDLSPDGDLDSSGLYTGATWLSEGQHALTLTVTDLSGKTGADQVVVTVGPPNSSPSCTITSPEDGGAAATGSSLTFSANVADPDQPADTLTARWTSNLDGLIGTEQTPASDGQVTLTWPGLSAGAHTVSLTVEDELGATCTDTVSWTAGSLPEVSITRPSAGEVVNQGATALFQGSVRDDEDAASALSVAWSSSLDGALSTAAPDSSGQTTFSTAALSPGLHIITLQATDTTGLQGSATTTLQINQAPSAPVVVISPSSPRTADDLGVVITTESVDPDGDAVSYSYRWYRDEVEMTSFTGTTVDASATTRGETWRVEVVASDGSASGAAGSDEVEIGNTAPTLTTVSLTPTSAYTNDTLTANIGSSDDDGDSVSASYAWTVNGTTISATGSSLSGVSWFDKGDRVAVTVTPSDGTDSGTPMSSTSLTILNTPPTAPGVTIDPSDPIEGEDDLLCELTSGSTDADGDSIEYDIAWTLGSTSFTDADTTLREGDTVLTEDIAGGDVWTCTVTPWDDETSGGSASDSVTVGVADIDYSDSWNMGTTISHTCAFGLVSINFSRWLISDLYPSISMTSTGSGQPGTMSGSFTSDTTFEVSRTIAGTCTETYTVTGTFVDENTLQGTFTAAFSGGAWCFGCTTTLWDFTATR